MGWLGLAAAFTMVSPMLQARLVGRSARQHADDVQTVLDLVDA